MHSALTHPPALFLMLVAHIRKTSTLQVASQEQPRSMTEGTIHTMERCRKGKLIISDEVNFPFMVQGGQTHCVPTGGLERVAQEEAGTDMLATAGTAAVLPRPHLHSSFHLCNYCITTKFGEPRLCVCQGEGRWMCVWVGRREGH